MTETYRYPKDFIKKVLVDEIGELVEKNFSYLSFALMAAGIELLGKCERSQKTWEGGGSEKNFNYALKLPGLNKYKDLIGDQGLYKNFRCGFAHSFIANKGIELTNGNSAMHLKPHPDIPTHIVLNCEDLYADFKEACEFIIGKEYAADNKMNIPFQVIRS